MYKFIGSDNSKVLPTKSHVANMALHAFALMDALVLFGKIFGIARAT